MMLQLEPRPQPRAEWRSFILRLQPHAHGLVELNQKLSKLM